MQKTINDFMKNKTKNGLLLIDMPVGYGKTYTAAQSIYEYARVKRNSKKVLFVTPLIKNLPIEELKKIYKSNGHENLFEKEVLVIKSAYEFVYERLLDVDIPAKYKSSAYYELCEIITKIKKLENRRDASLNEFIKELQKDVREKHEPAFRREIMSVIKRELPLSKSNRKHCIKNLKQYKWIGELYPTVFMDDYKIYLLTMKKFLSRNITLVEPSYEFIKSDIVKDSIVFIDEFDAVKATMEDHIIENAMNTQDDYIKLFEQIFKTISTHELPQALKRPYNKYTLENNSPITLELLSEEAQAIYNNYCLQYSYKTNGDGVDRKQSFLFNDNSYHTMLRNDKSYIRVTPNEEENHVEIYFENKEEYNSNKSEKDIIVYRLVRDINSFLNKFRIMVMNWAEKYVEEENIRRGDHENRFTLENAISSIYKEFSLSNNQINLMQNGLLNLNKTEADSIIPDMSFYNNGFKYFEFVDADEHLSKTIFNYVQVANTPEKIMLELSTKAKVIGISATATLKTVTGNFDIEYLADMLKENFKTVDNVTAKKLRKELEERWKAYAEGIVNIKSEIINYNKGKIGLEKRVLEIFGDNLDICKKYEMKLMKISEGNKYIWQRYCNIFLAIKSFMEYQNIKSFLCLNSVLPRYNKNSFDLHLIEDVANYFAKLFDVAGYEIACLKSDNFEEEKELIIEKLEQGKKVFILSTYKTIGAGQNMQYRIPAEVKTVNVFKSDIENDNRMLSKDIDAIFLGDITHIVANVYDKENFGKREMLDFFFDVEYLYQNNEINFDCLNRLIKQGFKAYSGSNERDNTAIEKLRKSKSVAKSVTKDVIQAIGRICRTFNKNATIYIFLVEELLSKMDVSEIENIILSPEMRAVVELKNNFGKSNAYCDDTLINKAEKISSRGKNYIMRMLSRNWTNRSMELWNQLRNCVLSYPTADIKNEEFKDIVNSLYIINKNNDSNYLFAQKGDFSDVVIDYDNDMAIFGESTKTKNKIISSVNEETSRLQQILKYPGMKTYFDENGWATEFGNGDMIMSPVLFQNIYKGALGEAAGYYVFIKEFGIDLKPITDPSKFEFFDYEISDGIYVDFKHWKYGYPEDRSTKLAEIKSKMQSIGAKKVYIVNIVSDKEFGVGTYNDGEIVEIPRLIDEDGNVDKNIMRFLKGELN